MNVFILLLCALPFGARAQNAAVDPEKARIYFAQEYGQDFAAEYNELNASGDLKDIYGYFAPKSERAALTKPLSRALHLRAEGTKVIFEVKGKTTLVMDVVDVVQQKYLLNGKPYVHDWNGDLGVQHQRIRGMLATRQNAALPPPLIFDLLMPRAQAIVPLLVAVAVDACVEGGCEAAAYLAGRAALWVFTKTPAVQAAVVGGTLAARKVAVEATKSAARSVGKVIQNISEDIYTDPEIVASLRSLKTALKTPSNYVKAPFKAAAFISAKVVGLSTNALVGAAAGISVFVISKAAEPYLKQGASPTASVSCALTSTSVESCAASPKVDVTPTAPTLDGGTLVDFWCATKNTNETSYIVAQTDKTNVVKVFRTNPAKDNELISALRYEVSADHQVKPDTFREYEIKDGKAVNKVTQPVFYLSSIGADDLVAKRSHALGADAKEEESDMRKQILKRDKILASITEKDQTKTLMQGEEIKDYAYDPLKSASDPERKKTDAEVAMAKDILPSFKQIISTCTSQAHAPEVKTAAAEADLKATVTAPPAGSAK